jgi:predicted Zn-dependent protease
MNNLVKLIKQKKFKAAEILLRKELAESPEDCYILTQLANVLWNRYKDQDALCYADKAKELSPTNPLLMFTRGRILWSLEKYEPSILEWDQILNMKELDIAENEYGIRWAKSIINDARYYKANCLYHLYRDKEALPIMTKHLQCRERGIVSDFSKKEAILFYKVLKYSPSNNTNDISEGGYATELQKTRISKRMDSLEKSKDWNKLVRYLKVICKHYPKEYYIKTVLSEYYKILGNKKECMIYAMDAFDQEPSDPLVKYNYAVALWLNGAIEDSLRQFEEIVTLGIDYIAFSEHGEGTLWAKRLMKDTKNNIIKIQQSQMTSSKLDSN